MKQPSKFFVLLLLFFTLLTNVNAQGEPTLRSIFNPSSCTRACWLGIEPGITTQPTVRSILVELGIVYEISPTSFPPIGRGEAYGLYLWTPIGTQPYIHTSNNSSAGIYFNNAIAERIVIPVNINLSQVTNEYGSPNRVLQVDDATLQMVYQNLGMIFEIRTDIDSDNVKTLYLSTNADIQSFFASAPPFTTILSNCSVFYSSNCSVATATPTVTLTPTPTPTPTPQPSSLISNIVVANGKAYTRDTVAAGNTLYIDRTYSFVTVPAELAGQDYIRTANADKQLTTAFTHEYRALVKAGFAANPPPETRPGKRRVAESPPRRLLKRLDRDQHAVLHFIHNFIVPFDNNLAERDLRMMKVKQKVSGCFRTFHGALVFERGSSLYTITAAGGGSPILLTTNASRPSWSSDTSESKIAFVRGSELYIYDFTNPQSPVEQITTGLGYVRYPAWSPDGSAIVFGTPGFPGALYVIPFVGGVAQNPNSPQALATNNVIWSGNPAWSPDGQYVAYQGEDAVNEEQIYYIGYNNNVPETLLLDNAFAADENPDWWGPSSYCPASDPTGQNNADPNICELPPTPTPLPLSSLTPIPTSQTTPSPTPAPTAICTVDMRTDTGAGANLRSAPDANAAAIAVVPWGTIDIQVINAYPPLSQSPTWTWLQVVFENQVGWLNASTVVVASVACEPRQLPPTPTVDPAILSLVRDISEYGVAVSPNGAFEQTLPWTLTQLQQILAGIQNTATAFDLLSTSTTNAQSLFIEVMMGSDNFGDLQILHVPNGFDLFGAENGVASDCNDGPFDIACTHNVNDVIIFYGSVSVTEYVLVHEFGHRFNARSGNGNGRASTSLYGYMESASIRDNNLNEGRILFGASPSLPLSPIEQATAQANGLQITLLSDNATVAEWTRRDRGWGTGPASQYSPAGTPIAIRPSNFQQNSFTVSSWTQILGSDFRQREIDEATADMFLNWVYRKITNSQSTQLGFKNTNWSPPSNCPTPSPCQDNIGQPGDVRFEWMEDQLSTIFTSRGW